MLTGYRNIASLAPVLVYTQHTLKKKGKVFQEQSAPANSCCLQVRTLAPTNKSTQLPHAKPRRPRKASMYMRCSCKGCRHSCTPCCRGGRPSEARSALPDLPWSHSRAALVGSFVHIPCHNFSRQSATSADRQAKHTANMHSAKSQGKASLNIANNKSEGSAHLYSEAM